MAHSKTGIPIPEYSTKKGTDEVPVAPCPGWTDECEFCEKRFGKWEEASEEVLAKVPTKPGIFAIALKNKNVTEVVDIFLDKSDIQKSGYIRMDQAKESVADKKSKSTKSVILCRWMTFKQPKEKDVVSLCAHWFNNGVLPKFMSEWPGLDILESSDAVEFSRRLEKFCHPQKDTFWKKPKGPPTKIAEVVEACVWDQPCEICDDYFGDWRKMDDVVFNDLAPSSQGIYMLAAQTGKRIETINIYYDPTDIALKINESMANTHKSLKHVLKNKRYHNTNTSFLVRWLEMSDVSTDNCCYLYAHWLNADKLPEMAFRLPGERQVDKNKYFVLRNHDKKWCYEIDIFKNSGKNKNKAKKEILRELKDDVRNLNCDDTAEE